MKLELDLNCFNWTECVLKTDLPATAKFLALYLATFMNNKQDIAWPQLTRIAKDTGLSKPTVIKYLNLLEASNWLIKNKKVHKINNEIQPYYHNEYKIDFPNMIKQQLTDLTDEDTRGKNETDQRLNSEGPEVKQFDSNNNRITKEYIKTPTHKKFQKPTLDEIKNYCHQRQNNVDAEKFYWFYESKGWKVGKTSMKNWKAAVITWERNSIENEPAEYINAI